MDDFAFGLERVVSCRIVCALKNSSGVKSEPITEDTTSSIDGDALICSGVFDNSSGILYSEDLEFVRNGPISSDSRELTSATESLSPNVGDGEVEEIFDTEYGSVGDADDAFAGTNGSLRGRLGLGDRGGVIEIVAALRGAVAG